MAKRDGGRIGDTAGGALLQQLRQKMGMEAGGVAHGGKPQPKQINAPAAHSNERDFASPKQPQPARSGRPTRQQPAPAAEKKPKVERIKISPEEYRRTIAAADAASGYGVDKKPKPSETKATTDFGKAAFERIATMRQALETLVADARAPATVDTRTRNKIVGRIKAGAATVGGIVSPGEGFIGCDFGTSSTKSVVRWPYDAAGGSALAVPVPKGWCSGEIPHLWPTAVYFQPETKMFAALPSAGFGVITGFKSALLDKRSHRMCGNGVTYAEAGVAFLTQYVAYLLGTIIEQQPEKQVSLINFGIPVARLSENSVAAEFKRVIEAALGLVPKADNLSLADVRAAFESPDPSPLEATYHAELSGAIAGYCSAPRHRQGPHMIIDCGSATLDIASFTLTDSPWPVGIYAAQVELLGADACKRYLVEGASQDECRRACRYQEYEVCGATVKQNRAGFQAVDNKYDYQVTLVGGGISSGVHQPFLEKMQEAFVSPFHRPRLGTDLKRDDKAQATRLILADGLARDPIDLRAVAMPLDPKDNGLGSGGFGKQDGLPSPITKDQM